MRECDSVLLLLLVFFLSAAVERRNAQYTSALVPAIISFGDSTVDVGNNNHRLGAVFKADFPPYGRDFKNHQPTGRFCNGKLVTDITAETLGFTSYPPAYLSSEATGENLVIGANFASAASGYYEGTARLYHAISLSRQLEYFKEYQSKLASVVGRRNASSIISGALYIVSTGNGDFVQNYYINPSLNKFQSVDAFSTRLAGAFSRFVTSLYALGARRIGVTSLPPLGCLPAMITLFGQGSHGGCVERLNHDADNFNMKLNSTVRSLLKQHRDLKLAIFDIYHPLYELANAPAKQGFYEARRGCCGTGTSGPSVLCSHKSMKKTCTNATSYVFWDGVHPSEAANRVLADSLLTAGIYLVT